MTHRLNVLISFSLCHTNPDVPCFMQAEFFKAKLKCQAAVKKKYQLEIDSNKKHSVNMTPLLNLASSFYAFYSFY